MNVVFDSMGTLFELTPVRERLGAAATEAWFERILHSAATLTVVGRTCTTAGPACVGAVLP